MPPGTLVPRDWLLTRLPPSSAAGEVGAEATSGLVDLSIHDLAQLFGRRPSTVRAWLERGEFPGAYKLFGREWRAPQSAVDAFLQSQRGDTAAPAKRTTTLSTWRSVNRRPA
jgi:excisionase family DNA binding protein